MENITSHPKVLVKMHEVIITTGGPLISIKLGRDQSISLHLANPVSHEYTPLLHIIHRVQLLPFIYSYIIH